MSEPAASAEPEAPSWAHPRAARLAGILLVLYSPQCWYFLMDYAWNDYRLFWLKFFPGLPMFIPAALITHVNAIPLIIVSWTLTAGVGTGLYFLSRSSRRMFIPALVLTCIWSAISAIGAYGAFRM